MSGLIDPDGNISHQYRDRYISRLTVRHGFSQERATEDFYATTEEDGFEIGDPEGDADESASYYAG